MIDYTYLFIQNPWWDNPQAINNDDKIVEFNSLKFQFFPNEVLNLKIRLGDINIITGPRQTGKSTTVKLFIKKLIEGGFSAKDTMFFNCDALSSEKDIIDLVIEFNKQVENKKSIIFLDEITSIENWPQGIKWLADSGLLKNSCLFLTGSSSISLKKSGEFLPGRRGKGKDIHFYPISFNDFVSMVGTKNYKELWERFLETGGFLRNINYGVKENISLYLATLRSELFKNGKKEVFLREVVRKLINSVSAETSYSNIAEEAELGSKNTALDYLSFLIDSFFLGEVKFYDIDQKRVVLKKNKKYYTSDPYVMWMFYAFVFGEERFDNYLKNYNSPAEKGKLVENYIATELQKTGNEIYFNRNSHEIDFVLPERKLAIEVKYKEKIVSNDLKSLENAPKQFTKILVSQKTQEKRGDVNIVPAHLATFQPYWPKKQR